MPDFEGDARAVAGELVKALGKPVADAALNRLAGAIAGRESIAKATGDRLTETPPDQHTRVAEEETQRWTGRIHDRMLDDPDFARQIRELARGDAGATLTDSPRSNQNTATGSGEAAIIQASSGATVTSTINRRSTTVNVRVPAWLAVPIAFMRSHFGAADEFNSFDRDTVPYTGTGTPTAAECKATVQHPGDGSYATADGQILCFAFPNGVVGYAKVITHVPSQATLQVVDLSR